MQRLRHAHGGRCRKGRLATWGGGKSVQDESSKADGKHELDVALLHLADAQAHCCLGFLYTTDRPVLKCPIGYKAGKPHLIVSAPKRILYTLCAHELFKSPHSHGTGAWQKTCHSGSCVTIETWQHSPPRTTKGVRVQSMRRAPMR